MIDYNKLFTEFKRHAPESLKANHYDLPLVTGIGTPEDWKEFLMDPKVSDYIAQETTLLQDAEFRALLFGISNNDTSVGKAQLINAMSNLNTKDRKKDGPVVIYSYVPLNTQQQKATNIEINIKDIFIKNDGV